MNNNTENMSKRELIEAFEIQQAEHVKLVAEIERLKAERDECHAFIFRNQAFVVRSIEKLKGIPEFEPTADVLNRVLQGTPKTSLEQLKLEQQAKGGVKALEELQHGLTWSKDLESMVVPTGYIADRLKQLRKQAEAE